MKGTPALYLGRIVEKKNFRAFIYAPNGGQRLVESWEEFEANMQSGLWFATFKDAMDSVIGEKPKTRTRRPKKETVLVQDEPFVDEDEIKDAPQEAAEFEVNDDFLPKG